MVLISDLIHIRTHFIAMIKSNDEILQSQEISCGFLCDMVFFH